MPLLRAGRPLKRWRYVGVYGPELMLCVGEARVGGDPAALVGGRRCTTAAARAHTAGRGGVDGSRAGARRPRRRDDRPARRRRRRASSRHAHGGAAYIWTRKQAGVPARGPVRVDGREFDVDCAGRRRRDRRLPRAPTSWLWSAGVGRGAGGERVGWNLVDRRERRRRRQRAHGLGRRRAARGAARSRSRPTSPRSATCASPNGRAPPASTTRTSSLPQPLPPAVRQFSGHAARRRWSWPRATA